MYCIFDAEPHSRIHLACLTLVDDISAPMSTDLFSDAQLVQDPDALLEAAAKQVATSLRLATSAGYGALSILAGYYTRVTPLVPLQDAQPGRPKHQPFCVALAQATLLYHLQMSRPNLQDIELWAQLIATAVSIVTANAQSGQQRRRNDGGADYVADQIAAHPLIRTVLRCGVLGMTPEAGDRRYRHEDLAGLEGFPPHMVVLLPPANFPAFSHLAVGLSRAQAIPVPLLEEWTRTLAARFFRVPSPLVALRAEQLVVRCVTSMHPDEHRQALQEAAMTCPAVVPLEMLRLLYFRLEACVPDVHNSSLQDRAMCVALAPIFLQFSSPVRRVFVEAFLYPSLCHHDMAPLLADPAARLHLCQLLLRLLPSSCSPRDPYYLSLCALLHPFLQDSATAAQTVLTLVSQHMPQGAYFGAAMALDRNMDPETFANIVLCLCRGLGVALGQLEHLASDPVGALIDNNAGLAYRCLYALRTIVRKVSAQPQGNARAGRVLVGLRSALPVSALAAMGQFAERSFTLANEADAEPATPVLLIAEMDTVLHGTNLETALDSLHEYYGQCMEICHFCDGTRATHTVCPTNGHDHLPNCQSKHRLSRSIAAECGGSEAVVRALCELLQQAPLSPATHRMVFEILRECGGHQAHLLQRIDAPLTAALERLAAVINTPNGAAFSNPVVAAQVVSGLIFVTRALVALSCTYGAASTVSDSVSAKFQLLIRTLLGVFSEEHRRAMAAVGADPNLVHHIAMAVWWCCGWMLRRSHSRCVQLKPTGSDRGTGTDAHKQDVVAAANALALLSALNTVHHVSPALERLVGLTTTRLIIDFNMQAPNIAEHLLSPFGVQRPDLDTCARFGLPTAADGHFWRFTKHQLRRSAPFKTSFVAALAQSCAIRFRGHAADPTQGLHATGVAQAEPVAPLFFSVTVDAMRQDGGLCRAIVQILSGHMRGDEVQPRSRRRRGDPPADAADASKAAAPGRRLLFAHTLQQVVACLQMTSAPGQREKVSLCAAEVAAVVAEAAHALVEEAPKLETLAAIAEPRCPPFAKLMRRVSDACAAGAPRRHPMPRTPPASTPTHLCRRRTTVRRPSTTHSRGWSRRRWPGPRASAPTPRTATASTCAPSRASSPCRSRPPAQRAARRAPQRTAAPPARSAARCGTNQCSGRSRRHPAKQLRRPPRCRPGRSSPRLCRPWLWATSRLSPPRRARRRALGPSSSFRQIPRQCTRRPLSRPSSRPCPCTPWSPHS
jgi:hypothetical protein